MATYWRKPAYLETDRDPITRQILDHAVPPGIYCEDEEAFRALQRGARTRGRPILATAGAGWELYGEAIRIATPAQAEFFRAVAAPAPAPEPETDQVADMEAAAAKISSLMGGQLVGASSPVPAAAPPPPARPRGSSRAMRRAAASEARRRA